ncbi:MAG: hypothetical protein HY558_00385 [Euryarchaeota archaeon]|nr:hypothetical protein [Euryarchaeota archaeon]
MDNAWFQSRLRNIVAYFPRFTLDEILEPIAFQEDEEATLRGRIRDLKPLAEQINIIHKGFRDECNALTGRIREAIQADPARRGTLEPLIPRIQEGVSLLHDVAEESRVGDIQENLRAVIAKFEEIAGKL